MNENIDTNTAEGVEKFEDIKDIQEQPEQASQKTKLLNDLFKLPAWTRFCQNFEALPSTQEKTLIMLTAGDQKIQDGKEAIIDYFHEGQKWLKEILDSSGFPQNSGIFNKEKKWDEFLMDLSELTNFVHDYGVNNEQEHLSAEEAQRIATKIAHFADRQRRKEEQAMAWRKTIDDESPVVDATINIIEDLCKSPERSVIPLSRREMVAEYITKNVIIRKRNSYATPVNLLAAPMLDQIAKLPLTFNNPDEEQKIETRIKMIMKNVALDIFHDKNTPKAA